MYKHTETMILVPTLVPEATTITMVMVVDKITIVIAIATIRTIVIAMVI
jgi:hypothetical protein